MHLLSSVWVEPAGVKGFWILPVVRIVMVGIETHHEEGSFGNFITRELEVVRWTFSSCTNSWWVET